jgi:DNA-binding transcriptional ArsR family regulator
MEKIDLKSLQNNAISVAETLKALAHETRLRVICAIGDKERSVLDMAECLAVGQSCLSQHLAKMRNLGILDIRRDGNMVYYRVKNQKVLTLVMAIKANLC